ncbi:hypothetical protein KR044_012589, partial [Drosophila immigrans]
IITNKVTIYRILLLKEAVEVKFTNVNCTSHNESWVHVYECRLKAISRNLTVFNVNEFVKYPANNITLDMQLFKRANGYKPWLIKTFIDVCRALRKAYNPYARLVYSLFKDFSNINHSCPYVGPIIVKGFHIPAGKIGLPLPTGEYLLLMKWYFDKKIQVTTKVYFSFTENYIDM